MRIVIAAFAVMSCSGDPRPATVTDREVAVTERELRALTALVDALDRSVGCAEAAAAIEVAAPELIAITAEVKAMVETGPAHDEAADRWMDKHYDNQLRSLTRQFRVKVHACEGDAAFATALARIRPLWT